MHLKMKCNAKYSTCNRGTLTGLLSDTSALCSSFSSATSDLLAAGKTLLATSSLLSATHTQQGEYNHLNHIVKSYCHENNLNNGTKSSYGNTT